MMARKYRLTTLGCKVNQYESQELRGVLSSLAWRPARQGEPADVAIVNTCAVTGSASRKNRQAIRRLNDGGKTPVIVVGCGASADAAQLERIHGVEAVLGHDTDVRTAVAELLKERFGPPPAEAVPIGRVRTDRPDKAHSVRIIPLGLPGVKEADALTTQIQAFDGHQRAFLKVQDGCDAFCSYCIIPRLRSTLRSKPVDVCVREARALVRSGHKEIIVTGIFLGAYGRDTAIRRRFTPGEAPLPALILALSQVEGLRRLRLSSLEPGDVTDELLDVLASNDNCVHHLHLPLQSGSGEVLRRMNRQYTREEFVDMVDRVQRCLDRPAITTDIIVGFPGETDADFEATCEIARYTGFSKIHAFPFSPRDRTAAARWQRDFVPPPVARERMNRLSDLEDELSLSFRRKFVGRRERVIVQSWLLHGDDTAAPMFFGRSDRYFEIHVTPADDGGAGCGDASENATDIEVGDLVTVRVDRVTSTRTHGSLLGDGARGLALPVLPCATGSVVPCA